MALDIVRGKVTNPTATKELIQAIEIINSSKPFEGTLYVGYPLTATDQSKITVDALLVTNKKGLIAFLFHETEADEEERQDLLSFQLQNTLMNYEALRKKRKLAFDPVVITIFPSGEFSKIFDVEEYFFCDLKSLDNQISELPDFDESLYSILCESLQKISTMKPKKKRINIRQEDSLGAKIKKIEREIANLDEWQKKAAFEMPEGPQRVRGLAGSGKTVVLALKAAYLHSQYPNWNIAVTFYTRALSQQFREMITSFSFEFMKDAPDWDRLKILHAWGTDAENGIYSETSRKVELSPMNYMNARSKYGRDGAFEGICSELLYHIPSNFKPYYDAILIDEAQDMPISFFKLCYKIAKEPKRIIFGYDELQNLNNSVMPSLTEMFGTDDNGNPLVELHNIENEPRRDIVLPVCYRNTPWVLTLAHSLGFGIYRKEGLVQLFDDLNLWDEIGYKVEAGGLDYGEQVRFRRKEDASPKYFNELLNPDESIIVKSFDSAFEQYQWISEEIEKNIKKDELDPDDILVVFPEAYYAKSQYMDLRQFLLERHIDSILAGVTVDRDTFRIKNCVTCSSIYRAKGNEAPMVYIVNSEYCAQGAGMITLRNTLFTALTRSRAWVRICGLSPSMAILSEEIQKCRNENFALDFKIPAMKEIKSLRLIHRDRSEVEKKKIQKTTNVLNELIKSLEDGELDLSVVPEINKLINTVQNLKSNVDEKYDEEDLYYE